MVLNQRVEEELRTDLLAILSLRFQWCGDTVRKSRKIRLYLCARQLSCAAGSVLRGTPTTRPRSCDCRRLSIVKTKIRDLILPSLPPWHRNAPREVLVGAIFDACRAVSACDKSGGRRQDEDFARVRFARARTPDRPSRFDALSNRNQCLTWASTGKLGDLQMAEKLPVPENSEHLPSFTEIRSVPPELPYDEKLPPMTREPSAGGGSRPGSAFVSYRRLSREDRRGCVPEALQNWTIC